MKLPVVAIIGQTNAGKSSLFNRLARRQQAIVAREAGTTRDNVVTKIDDRYLLIDTAGLKDPDDEFEANIQNQIDDAVESADLILLALDSSKYPNHDDKLIAKKALKSGKPTLLLLNKSDLGESLPDEEFLSLGIKYPLRTSATTSLGLNNLRDRITDELTKLGFKDKPVKTEDDSLKIALIGRPNVGKSSLFNTLAEKQQAIVANLSGTTRDINRTEIRYKGRTIELLDTAGLRKPGKREVGIEKFSALRSLAAIEEADVCCLLVDSTEPHSKLDQALAGQIVDAGKGIILVVTKTDLEHQDTDEILDRLEYDFKFIPYAPVILTSSVTGKNATKIFELATQIDRARHAELKTSDLNKVLHEAIRMHPPAGLKNTHPRLRYMVQTDTCPPWFVVYGSNLSLLHWSYKRYLERCLREAYPFEGTPIFFSFRNRD
ncbi:MAG: ribosome biogenesis GTPase Der [Candidatus Nanosyncoccaceae bacterium]